MSRRKQILCVLLALAVVIVGICCWQRNNLRALGMSLRLSQDELSGEMDRQRERTEEAARQAGVSVRALTDEEKQTLRGSEVSREELIDRITDSVQPAIEQTVADDTAADDAAADNTAADDTAADNTAAADTAAPSSAQQPQPQEPEDSEQTLRDQLARQIAEIYVMEAEYTDWLEQANQDAIDEFTALPESEQTTANKYSIGMTYLSAALEKEKECDAEMKTAEDAIRSLLTQLGDSTSLVDEIHAAYLEEKAAKKAYYLSLH